MKRNSFIAAIAAPFTALALGPEASTPLPKAAPKPPKPSSIADELPQPLAWEEVSFSGCFTLKDVNRVFASCWFGKLHPKEIRCSRRAWEAFWAATYHTGPYGAAYDPNGRLRKLGWRTFDFNGAEVVMDSRLPEGHMWIVTPEAIAEKRRNARVRFTFLEDR